MIRLDSDITADNCPKDWTKDIRVVFWPGESYEYTYGSGSELEVINLEEGYVICGVTGPDGSIMLAPWSRTGDENDPWAMEFARFIDFGEFEVRDPEGNVLARSSKTMGARYRASVHKDGVTLPHHVANGTALINA